MGMTGLETGLSVVQEAMVDTGLLDWAGVARRMSAAPARIGRLAGQGRPLAAGEPAHLTLVDPAAVWDCDPAAMATSSRNSPLRGRKMTGRVVATFYGGHPTVLDGRLNEPVAAGVER
jgi:dihydroorotase